MVFRSVPETDTHLKRDNDSIKFTSSDSDSIMAASSTAAKPPPHPLHNFSLPEDLKWSMNNHANPHRFRKLPAASANQNSGTSPDRTNDQSEKKTTIMIRFRAEGTRTSDAAVDAGDQAPLAEDMVPKTWNLRPRRSVTKPLYANEGALKIPGPAGQENKAPTSVRSESGRLRNGNTSEGKVSEKKEKEKRLKFSIPLTKEEIEEDIFVLTGSKPARRPKKRAKHVQKQLDFVFPGLWLASITPDSYRVSDAPSKG